MRKLLATVAVLAALVGAASPVYALTAEALAFACMGNVPDLKKDKNTAENVKLCHGYITGWDDARFAFLQGTTTYCPPPTFTTKEASVVFFDYVATHRETKDLPAAETLMLAFKAKWPCKP